MPDGVYFLVVLNIMIHIAKVPEGASILTINFLEIISQLIISNRFPDWASMNFCHHIFRVFVYLFVKSMLYN